MSCVVIGLLFLFFVGCCWGVWVLGFCFCLIFVKLGSWLLRKRLFGKKVNRLLFKKWYCWRMSCLKKRRSCILFLFSNCIFVNCLRRWWLLYKICLWSKIRSVFLIIFRWSRSVFVFFVKVRIWKLSLMSSCWYLWYGLMSVFRSFLCFMKRWWLCLFGWVI